METSEAVPRGGVRGEDLASLVRGPGPFLTLYFDTRPDVENAGRVIEQRWRTLRADLNDRSVPQEVLEHVDPVVPGAHLGGGGAWRLSRPREAFCTPSTVRSLRPRTRPGRRSLPFCRSSNGASSAQRTSWYSPIAGARTSTRSGSATQTFTARPAALTTRLRGLVRAGGRSAVTSNAPRTRGRTMRKTSPSRSSASWTR